MVYSYLSGQSPVPIQPVCQCLRLSTVRLSLWPSNIAVGSPHGCRSTCGTCCAANSSRNPAKALSKVRELASANNTGRQQEAIKSAPLTCSAAIPRTLTRLSVLSLQHTAPEGLSGPESDSDGPSGSYFSPPQTTAAADLASSQPPLGVITEKLNADGEESDDDEEGEWQPPSTPSEFDDHNHDDVVIKSGYLWKKGERRKVREVTTFSVPITSLSLEQFI